MVSLEFAKYTVLLHFPFAAIIRHVSSTINDQRGVL